MLDQAIRVYQKSGLSIIPINRKTKRPASWLLPQKFAANGQLLYWQELAGGRWVETTQPTGRRCGTWEPYQVRPATTAEAARWLRDGIQAAAVVCGAVSGGVEILDFDTDANGATWFDAWCRQCSEIVDRYDLPLQQTGGMGYQIAWRCTEIAGNQKLAWAIAPEEKSGRTVMIETRGEGGYALLPPSIHPSGRSYELVQGKFSKIPTITPGDRRVLLECARNLSEWQPQAAQGAAVGATYADGPNEVIEAYNQLHSIEEALQRYGYTHSAGNRWSRPGKADSAGVQVLGDGRAYAFSSNDTMAGDRMGDSRPFSAFDLMAYNAFSEDYKAAYKAAAIETGLHNELTILLYVQGWDNARAARELMFPNGWVVRGWEGDKINLENIDDYPTVIVLASHDWDARRIAAQVNGCPYVVPNGYDPQRMAADGVLCDYLSALAADAQRAAAVGV